VIFVVLVPNYNKDAMFLILYGFHDPSLNKSVMLFLISSSIVNSRVEYVIIIIIIIMFICPTVLEEPITEQK
jgi:hypothetical protein